VGGLYNTEPVRQFERRRRVHPVRRANDLVKIDELGTEKNPTCAVLASALPQGNARENRFAGIVPWLARRQASPEAGTGTFWVEEVVFVTEGPGTRCDMASTLPLGIYSPWKASHVGVIRLT
jgi:hypothetical protein